MFHGPLKRREIARSVLPSTRRKFARHHLAALRRRNRRAIGRDLRAIARASRSAAVVDVFDDALVDLRAYPDSDIGMAVWNRRDGDKLGPLLRWGRARTRNLPLDERLEAVRRLFDDNLIGRHALSHLEWDPHFRVVHEHERYWSLDSDRLRRSCDDDHRASALRALVGEALEHGDHAALNRWMRANPTAKGTVRVLAGLHDVDAFVAECIRCGAWRRGLEAFPLPARPSGRRRPSA